MECSICFNPMTVKYQLTNCSHSICVECAKECKDRSTINSVTVDGNFPIHTEDIYQPMACPLCRQVEKKMTPEEFKKYYPDDYDEWFQLELNCDEFGDSFYTTYEPELFPPPSIKTYFKFVKHQRIPKPMTWRKKTIRTKGKRKI
jgi:hypothetical protein